MFSGDRKRVHWERRVNFPVTSKGNVPFQLLAFDCSRADCDYFSVSYASNVFPSTGRLVRSLSAHCFFVFF